jgi:hypothetical protein
MRVLVCGGRNYSDRATVERVRSLHRNTKRVVDLLILLN